MRLLAMLLVVAGLSAAPSVAAEVSLGLGYSSSAVNNDTPRGGDDSLTLRGLGVRTKIAVGERWGVEARYLKLDDDFTGGGDLELDRLDLLASYEFFRSELNRHRLQVTFGAALLDFRERVPLGGSFSDDTLGPAAGLGWEWGSNRVAFFMDFVVTFVDVDLAAGNESWSAGALLSGLTYRF